MHNPQAGDRARSELLADAGRSDTTIAEITGASKTMVLAARRELERSG